MNRKSTRVVTDESENQVEVDSKLGISSLWSLLDNRQSGVLEDVYVDTPPSQSSDVLVARVSAALKKGHALIVPTEFADPYSRWAKLYLTEDTEGSTDDFVIFRK